MTTVFVITDDGNITIVEDGNTHIITKEHPNYAEIIKALKLA